ncbi:phosphatase [Adhaeribacter aerolatus]|uniref:Phosphatase n=1 Tax=Adhaeribacter aerolatus TaxID=670289 RepID=A0A512B3E8_9BACT|nr:phosphatase [Adhaeribacter aerolatus]
MQYANRENQGTRHYRSSIKKLTEAVEVFNQQKPAFVISLGDFINDDFKSYDTLNSITNRLKPTLFHVIGNHDFEVAANQKSKVLPALKLKNEYYSFNKKNWKFILLNGNDISLIANTEGTANYKEAQVMLDKLKAAKAPNAQPWNGGLGQEQLNWLKDELASAQKKNQRVIVFCHFPLYPEELPYNLWNASEVRNLIERYANVKAYLNGHVHKSQYFSKNGVNYVTFKGMVEKEENAFAIVSVFEDHLEIQGYGKEVSRVLKK